MTDAALARDESLLRVLDRQTTILDGLANAVAGLDRLDDERKSDIDELREEVAALGAKVDAVAHVIACTGAPDCPAKLHVEGCFGA